MNLNRCASAKPKRGAPAPRYKATTHKQPLGLCPWPRP
jgi:hypothetical protein